ncbi:MAG: carbonic anhydrase [Nitrosomonadales bacterium]|mgnify:FL=1|jgi:carbonic anhydrase|nr:carbonic anhydrase [Nitrosomonadales bacterium]MBT7482119.1 carbonic anhydrase [Nitrosomonadales bacterium]MBT7690051.1 carbonic anhydrase [Nitrosomonadales bacterium]
MPVKQLRLLKVFYLFLMLSLSHLLIAGETHPHDIEAAKQFINEALKVNKSYISKNGQAFFKKLSKGQQPRATIVGCADSRAQTNKLSDSPEGDIFMIRNIGNQVRSTMGSVQYGINHLASPVLLIIGHSNCGAISAASSDYSSLEKDIQKELRTINISKGIKNINGVIKNVNNQVEIASTEFNNKLSNDEILIVGAVYDFANDMKQGPGKLNIININGKTNPVEIKQILSNL